MSIIHLAKTHNTGRKSFPYIISGKPYWTSEKCRNRTQSFETFLIKSTLSSVLENMNKKINHLFMCPPDNFHESSWYQFLKPVTFDESLAFNDTFMTVGCGIRTRWLSGDFTVIKVPKMMELIWRLLWNWSRRSNSGYTSNNNSIFGFHMLEYVFKVKTFVSNNNKRVAIVRQILMKLHKKKH